MSLSKAAREKVAARKAREHKAHATDRASLSVYAMERPTQKRLALQSDLATVAQKIERRHIFGVK